MDRLAAMEAFVRVVDTGSFSAAADQLRIGQPAVSKAVAQLEARFGVRLLLRTSRALTVTEAGQHYYERARRAMEEVSEAELAARGAGARLSGRLRFSAPVTFARLHLIPKLPDFMAQHPELSIQAVLDDRNVNPVEERIDVALRMGALADSALTARRIAQCDRLIVGTPTYFERFGMPTVPSELKLLRAVIYTGAGGGTSWMFKKDVQTSITLKESVLMTAAEGVREAVFAGMGFAVASEWMFSPDLESGRVISVLPDWKLPHVDLWAVFPTGRQASAKSRAFAGFVESTIASMVRRI